MIDRTMVMLIGPTGCGKTTFRKKYLTTLACISPDDFISGGWTSDKRALAWGHAGRMAELFFRDEESFVVDAQFVTADLRNEWVKKAKRHDYKVVAVCLLTSWSQILKNHEKRGDRGGYGIIPREVIKESYWTYQKAMTGTSNWHLFDKKIVVKWGSSDFKKQEVMDELWSM